MTLGATIRRIVRTALLCGTLGLLLYLALAGIVENPTGAALLPSLFGVIATAPLLVLTVQDVTAALSSGVFPGRTGAVLREREPAWFWALMIWQTAMIFALMALLLYTLSLLIEAVQAGNPGGL
jgi:hypothetical protein